MKEKFIIQVVTKCLFVMFITFKAFVFVYENVIPLLEEAKISYSIDIDSDDFEDDDFEKELEEKTEVNESDLVSYNFNFQVYIPKTTKMSYFFVVKTYREQHLEFSTPPPELLV